jgi:hypothetical protein
LTPIALAAADTDDGGGGLGDLGSILGGLLGDGGDDGLAEHPFLYSGGEDNPTYAIEAPDDTSLTSPDFDGTQTVNVVEVPSDDQGDQGGVDQGGGGDQGDQSEVPSGPFAADGGAGSDDETVVGSFDAEMDQSQLLGFIDNTELQVPDYDDPSEFFTGADDQDGDPGQFPADAVLPSATTFDEADFGLGISNIYAEIPPGDDGGGGIQDVLVTPLGDLDLSQLVSPIVQITEALADPGSVDLTDLLGSVLGS